MSISIVDGSLQVRGQLACNSFVIPAGTIVDASVSASAGIVSEKLEQQYLPLFTQPNTTAAAETRVIHVVRGTTGTIEAFRAGSIAKNSGAAVVTVDLKKNGSSVLSAVITLDNANTNRVAEDGVIASPNVVAGDVLEVVITATAGGGTLATGVFAQACVQETAN